MPVASRLTASSSVVLPTPASPSRISAPPRPSLASASNASTLAISASLPCSTLKRAYADVQATCLRTLDLGRYPVPFRLA